LAAAATVGAGAGALVGALVGAAAGFTVAVGVVGAGDEHAASSGSVTASALWRRNVRRLSAFIPYFPPL
jgi:hypothetical protein